MLTREGTSFTRIIDGQRRALAEDAIARGETAGRVAARLGFSDRRAFTRAFKRWTGRTPSDAASDS